MEMMPVSPFGYMQPGFVIMNPNNVMLYPYAIMPAPITSLGALTGAQTPANALIPIPIPIASYIPQAEGIFTSEYVNNWEKLQWEAGNNELTKY
mmetsp:Transcript_4625/g.5533  ORF Transcript_4625/g.5533 Transcript_4625/m.5533 type:complete len:94 (-) Transcript_4625:566-847(-)